MSLPKSTLDMQSSPRCKTTIVDKKQSKGENQMVKHRHMGHLEDKNHKCSSCDKKFKTKSCLVQRVRTHLRRIHECGVFSKSFLTKKKSGYARAHPWIHLSIPVKPRLRLVNVYPRMNLRLSTRFSLNSRIQLIVPWSLGPWIRLI